MLSFGHFQSQPTSRPLSVFHLSVCVISMLPVDVSPNSLLDCNGKERRASSSVRQCHLSDKNHLSWKEYWFRTKWPTSSFLLRHLSNSWVSCSSWKPGKIPRFTLSQRHSVYFQCAQMCPSTEDVTPVSGKGKYHHSLVFMLSQHSWSLNVKQSKHFVLIYVLNFGVPDPKTSHCHLLIS